MHRELNLRELVAAVFTLEHCQLEEVLLVLFAVRHVGVDIGDNEILQTVLAPFELPQTTSR